MRWLASTLWLLMSATPICAQVYSTAPGAPGDPTIPALGQTAISSSNAYSLSDNVNAGMNDIAGVYVRHSFGGTSTQGNRAALLAYISLDATPNASDASLQDYVSVLSQGYANAPAKTGLIGGNQFTGYAGNIWGGNDNVWIAALATNWSAIYGREIDVSALSGSSVAEKFGLMIVQSTTDAVQGSIDDAALNISNGITGLSNWKIGIELGGIRKNWPFSSSSTLIGATLRTKGGTPNAMVAANGVDFRGIAFGSYAFAATGFSVDGSGNIVAASYSAGSSAGVSCSGVPTSGFTVTNGIVTHC